MFSSDKMTQVGDLRRTVDMKMASGASGRASDGDGVLCSVSRSSFIRFVSSQSFIIACWVEPPKAVSQREFGRENRHRLIVDHVLMGITDPSAELIRACSSKSSHQKARHQI
jgi:hypothetical protein